MYILKRFGLMFALMFVLAAGFGCSSKTVDTGTVPPEETSAATDELEAAEKNAIATITDGKVYFAFDRYDIAPEYKAMLNEKAELLKQFPNLFVRIEGNCDDRGTQEYNLALGERRARAVYEYLLALGVPADQMDTISFGKERPAVLGNNEEAWAQNRRDEFVVTVKD